ncbi:SDR family oxidoreductase [Paenibacillus sp. GCM10023248]|uniref:SDR family oxidoreductase n=1 Tax=Bacillales TaxID=1385 RepID=UPI002379482E|nr:MULTISPECIES: SDR family oxidoreductase [Bacillales]MDD9271305.1 SDR family oxidoreductase [Paenibacillus sp. MAHUQ-63]MDR6881573.1 3-oxoacyl-[acyl-carrier protein] reductase [Bacillus sp. 3255]
MELKGRTVLITGSAKGLGKMTAITLAKQGCQVAVNYVHSAKEANELVAQLHDYGVRSIAVQGDVARREDILRMVERTADELGPIDILVNNAGPFMRERRFFADYEVDEIEYFMRGNLLGVMELDRLVLPMMRQRRWGRIIHFGFGKAAEARGWTHRAVYAAAKVGLVSFTKTLAEEEASHGITVNMICPGDIRGKHKEQTMAEARQEVDGETPVGRPGTGEDVARVIEFLCLPASDFITGNIMDISGALDPIQPLPVLNQRKS